MPREGDCHGNPHLPAADLRTARATVAALTIVGTPVLMLLILPGLGIVKSVNVTTLTLPHVWPVAAGAYLILEAFRIAEGIVP